jgi:hypothetical protein
MSFADPGQPAPAIDYLATIPPGRTPANPVGLDERHRKAAFGEGEGGGDSGKARPDHADIRRLAALEHRVIGNLIS